MCAPWLWEEAKSEKNKNHSNWKNDIIVTPILAKLFHHQHCHIWQYWIITLKCFSQQPFNFPYLHEIIIPPTSWNYHSTHIMKFSFFLHKSLTWHNKCEVPTLLPPITYCCPHALHSVFSLPSSTHLLQLFPHFHPSPLSCLIWTFFHHYTLLSILYDQFLLFYITHFQVLYIITFSFICRSYPSLALPLPLSSFVSSQLNTTLRYLFQSPTQLYLNK